MKPRMVLIGLFLLATVLVDVVTMLIVRRYAEAPQWSLFVTSALLKSQATLVAIWLALGRTPGPLKLIGALLVVVLWDWQFSLLPNMFVLISHLIRYILAVSLPLLVLRLLGAGLTDVSAAPEAEDGELDPRPFQFSILYLLAWTTALAVTLGTLKWLLLPGGLAHLLKYPNWFALSFVGNAAIAICALWASLGTRWIVVRILSLPLVVVAVFAMQVWLLGPFFLTYITITWSLEALFLVGSLLVFRMAGYRFRWRNRRVRKMAADPGDGNPEPMID